MLGRKALFDEAHFVTEVFIYGGDFEHLIEGGQYETYFWQLVRLRSTAPHSARPNYRLIASHLYVLGRK